MFLQDTLDKARFAGAIKAVPGSFSSYKALRREEDALYRVQHAGEYVPSCDYVERDAVVAGLKAIKR